MSLVEPATDVHGPPADENPVHAVGIGPGDPAFLTMRGSRILGDVDVVVGFETVVGFIESATDATLLSCSYDNETEVLDRFADRIADGATGAAVLMGDPNVSSYGFLEKVERAVDRPVRIVPGISSIQIAASRARTPLEDSTVVTLHKRGELDEDLRRLARDAGVRHLLVLPRPYDWMPGDIADTLVSAGASTSLPAFVFERLTIDGETVRRTTLGDLAEAAAGDGPDDTPFSDLTVLVVKRGT